MTKISCVKVLLCWCALLITCFAQTTTPVDETLRPNQNQTDKSSDDSTSKSVFTRRGALPFKKTISREQKKLLQPDDADLNSYAAFLKNPHTGLIKLLPDIGCEDNANIIRADANCLKSIPMSAFYSFREEEHTTDFLADIRLKDNVLITDGLLTQGILVALGDIALENVALSSDGLSFLNEYKASTKSDEALKQTTRLANGIESGGYLYRKSQPAMENTTYALRVIAYRAKFIQSFNGVPYDMLAGDNRLDIMVAFRVLKKDAAGNITLLWKELSRRDAPKVIFPKKEKTK